MEVDKRQGDLFLHLLEGGVKDEFFNFRSKLDAVAKQGCQTFDKEGNLTEVGQTVEVGSQFGT